MKTITITYYFDGNDFDYEVYEDEYNEIYDKIKQDTNEEDEDELAEMVKDYLEDDAREAYENQISKWKDEWEDLCRGDIHGGI
jgi:predicted transcriptional regulator